MVACNIATINSRSVFLSIFFANPLIFKENRLFESTRSKACAFEYAGISPPHPSSANVVCVLEGERQRLKGAYDA